jgi:hypothetical protein
MVMPSEEQIAGAIAEAKLRGETPKVDTEVDNPLFDGGLA